MINFTQIHTDSDMAAGLVYFEDSLYGLALSFFNAAEHLVTTSGCPDCGAAVETHEPSYTPRGYPGDEAMSYTCGCGFRLDEPYQV